MRSNVSSLEENPLAPTYRYAIGNHVRKRFIQEWLPQMKGAGFNFGAGSSDWSEHLSPHASMRRMDIDFSEARHLDLITDIQHAGIKSGSLDWILCSEVIEHVLDFKKALREIGRCLKSSGKLILTVPFAIPLHGEPYDYWRFTQHALQSLAQESGFKIIRLEGLGNFSVFYWQSLAAEYHRRFAWVPPGLSGLKRAILKCLSLTVPFFCRFCFMMASPQNEKKEQKSGQPLCWGACLEKA